MQNIMITLKSVGWAVYSWALDASLLETSVQHQYVWYPVLSKQNEEMFPKVPIQLQGPQLQAVNSIAPEWDFIAGLVIWSDMPTMPPPILSSLQKSLRLAYLWTCTTLLADDISQQLNSSDVHPLIQACAGKCQERSVYISNLS